MVHILVNFADKEESLCICHPAGDEGRDECGRRCVRTDGSCPISGVAVLSESSVGSSRDMRFHCHSTWRMRRVELHRARPPQRQTSSPRPPTLSTCTSEANADAKGRAPYPLHSIDASQYAALPSVRETTVLFKRGTDLPWEAGAPRVRHARQTHPHRGLCGRSAAAHCGSARQMKAAFRLYNQELRGRLELSRPALAARPTAFFAGGDIR